MAYNSHSNTELFLQNEGILDKNEQFETVYLAEDEIEKFMEKYLKENPGTEIETRYINHSPVEVTQDIEVRWLRPETPEIPPIIIKEVDVVDNEPPTTIRIVQKAKQLPEDKREPVIIREKPKLLPTVEPKIIYVKNENPIIKVKAEPPPLPKPNNANSNTPGSNNREIKIEHVRSNSQTRLLKSDSVNTNNNTNTNKISRLEFDEQVKTDKTLLREIPHYSFEEHASIVDYEEEFEHHRSTIEESADEQYRYRQKVFGPQRTLEEERQLKLYEEKLMQTLYEEYLLRLEREKIERKLQAEGVFEERLREKSMSQERLSQLRMSQNRISQSRLSAQQDQRIREEEVKEQLFRERLLREQQLREEEHRMQRIREQQLRDEEIRQQRLKEMRLKEQDQLFRSNSNNGKLINPATTNALGRSPSETSTYKSIKFNKVTDENELRRYNQILSDPKALSIKNKAEADRIMSSFEVDVQHTLNTNNPQQQQQQQPQQQPPLQPQVNNKSFNNTNTSIQKVPSTNYIQSNDYHTIRQSANDLNTKPFNDSLSSNSILNKSNNNISRSGSGIRRHRVTSITSYYTSNYPNPTTEKSVYVSRY